ncbi:MAG: DUF2975 domain-containing protein [Acutalibacter sp.]|nr:DUF2975 domain-containing protein [Acutalibacter sp.]
MKQSTLSKWLKLILAGLGVCGIIIYALVIPMLAETMVDKYPEFNGWKWPWLILIWVTALPCYSALVLGWKIAANIGADHSFSLSNASLLKWIAILAAVDSAVFFVGNLVYLLLSMNHPSVVLFSLLIVFLGVAISVASAALSHLVRKAAELQTQSDLTI